MKIVKDRLNDRIAAVILFMLFLFALVDIQNVYVPFSPDPLGPKMFPSIIAAIGMLASIYLFFSPAQNKAALEKSQIVKMLLAGFLLLFYAFCFELLGFIISTAIVTFIVSYMFGLSPLRAIIYAILLSVLSYILLVGGLELNLPKRIIEDTIDVLLSALKRGA
ncbi:MAG: tripartite tricarboxylate transporter TctB family protein [Alphaproteobacteria bacterium]